MKALSVAVAIVVVMAANAPAQTGCPPPTGKDFTGKNLVDQNFSGQDLRGANFTKALLDGAQFVNANLTGAIFPGVTLAPSSKAPVSFVGATLTGACFAGATLRKTNLLFADLTCTDFSRADVSEAVFGPEPRFDPGQNRCGRAKFVETVIGVRQIPFALWRFIDFTKARFTDLRPDTFRSADLTGAMLVGVNFGSFDFTDATLTNADLREADLRGAKFDKAKAQWIKLDRAKFRFGTALGAADFTAASMRGFVAPDSDFSGAILDSAVLRGANFAGADLHGANLKRATLEPGEDLGPTEVSGANLNGAMLDEAHLNFVSFQNTRLIGATITRVKLADTDFSNAMMPNTDFFGATLEGVTFHGSSLENAKFVKAKLERSKSGKSLDLACTQLGGADLSNLDEQPLEGAVTFIGAVLPDAAECRKTADGFYCGTEPAGQKPYGPTLLPTLTHPVTCPNSDFTICSGKTWLLPDWSTTACGRQQRRWDPPPPEPPPPGKTVHIPDKNFAVCLSRQFFNNDDTPIPTDFAAKVQEINCASRGIADATGLEAFTKLRKLTLTSNKLTNGEIFGRLGKLQILQVSDNQLTTLNVRIESLKSLNAANNAIQRVSGLETADLESVDLSHNRLTEFALDSQRMLFFADLSHNLLTDAGDLSDGFTALASLYLQNNDLTTIGSLADATKLTYLNLGSNPKFKCETLKVSKEILDASNCGK
jgi:uncharacterized protein YjbI with pentapeptide repeats